MGRRAGMCVIWESARPTPPRRPLRRADDSRPCRLCRLLQCVVFSLWKIVRRRTTACSQRTRRSQPGGGRRLCFAVVVWTVCWVPALLLAPVQDAGCPLQIPLARFEQPGNERSRCQDQGDGAKADRCKGKQSKYVGMLWARSGPLHRLPNEQKTNNTSPIDHHLDCLLDVSSRLKDANSVGDASEAAAK